MASVSETTAPSSDGDSKQTPASAASADASAAAVTQDLLVNEVLFCGVSDAKDDTAEGRYVRVVGALEDVVLSEKFNVTVDSLLDEYAPVFAEKTANADTGFTHGQFQAFKAFVCI
jgi:hypothetical protein